MNQENIRFLREDYLLLSGKSFPPRIKVIEVDVIC